MKMKSLEQICDAIGANIIIVPPAENGPGDSGVKKQDMKKQKTKGQCEWDMLVEETCKIANEALSLLIRGEIKEGLDMKDAFMSQIADPDFNQLLLSLSLAVQSFNEFEETKELRWSVFSNSLRAAIVSFWDHKKYRLRDDACVEEQKRLIGDKKVYTFLELFAMTAYKKSKTKKCENR